MSTMTSQIADLCAGNSPGTGEFPAQMASNAENVSIWWRHHGNDHTVCKPLKGQSRIHYIPLDMRAVLFYLFHLCFKYDSQLKLFDAFTHIIQGYFNGTGCNHKIAPVPVKQNCRTWIKLSNIKPHHTTKHIFPDMYGTVGLKLHCCGFRGIRNGWGEMVMAFVSPF